MPCFFVLKQYKKILCAEKFFSAVFCPFGIVFKDFFVEIFELEIRSSGFVQNDHGIRVQLQCGTADHGGHGSFDGSCGDSGFAFAGNQLQNFFGIQHGTDTGGVSTAGHGFRRIEVNLVRLAKLVPGSLKPT